MAYYSLCSIGSAACHTVKRDVFETGKLADAVKERFGSDSGTDSDEIEKAWSLLYAALVPSASSFCDTGGDDSGMGVDA